MQSINRWSRKGYSCERSRRLRWAHGTRCRYASNIYRQLLVLNHISWLDKAGIQFRMLNRSKGAAVWVWCSLNLLVFLTLYPRVPELKWTELSTNAKFRKPFLIKAIWKFIVAARSILSSTIPQISVGARSLVSN